MDRLRQRAPSWIDGFGRYPVLVAIYLVVKYHSGMDSVIRVHDTLDGSQAVLQRMSLGDLFSGPDATLDFMLGGLPRSSIGSEIGVSNLIAVVLPLFWSLVVAEIIYRSIAYYGMRRLLCDTGLGSERLVLLVVPSLFAIFPFWHPGFASIAGIPLLLSALLRLHRGSNHRELAIVAVFPLLAQPSSTIPYTILLGGYVVVGSLLRKVPRQVFAAVGWFAGVLAVSEWRQLYALVSGPTSHRIEMTGTPATLSSEVFRLGRTLLQTVEKHSFDSPVTIVPVAVLLVAVVVAGSLVWSRRVDGPSHILWVTLVAMVGVLLASGAWRFFDRAARSVAGDYPTFQVDRGVWLLPALTYLAIAAAAVALFRLVPRRVAVVLLVAVFTVQGTANWQKADFDPDTWEQLTLDEFYAPDVFSEVRSLIGEGAVVVSVGLHPAVSIYNGLEAADGYGASYPVDYKHRWRALIAPALEVDERWRSYFDQWGSRAYLFQPGLEIYPACCDEEAEPIDLLADAAAFGELGITHLLSIVEITNSDEVGLTLLGAVDQSAAGYVVWVYGT
jgi:hypothetical protein